MHVRRPFVRHCEESEDKPKILWEYVTGKHVPGPVVLGPNKTSCLHATDGYRAASTASTGKQNWPPACVGEPLGYAAPGGGASRATSGSAASKAGILKVDPRGHLQKPGMFFRSRQKFDSAGHPRRRSALRPRPKAATVFAIEAAGERGKSLWSHAGNHGFAGWCVHRAPAMTDNGVLVLPATNDILSRLKRWRRAAGLQDAHARPDARLAGGWTATATSTWA